MRIPKTSSISMSSRLPAILATAMLAGGPLAGCNGDSSDDSSDPDVQLDALDIAELESSAERAVEAGIPGVVVVVRADDQIVRIARGVSDLSTAEPMLAESRFRVASLAKSFVASVVLQLVDEGALALTDTVDDRLPGMLAANGDATIEDLLRLESGIFDYASDERLMAPYYAGDFEYAWTPEQLVALANDHEPLFAPGEGWSYSNTNYTLLALMIEQVTGNELADVVRERITEPLGMSSSTMATTSELDAPYSHGYLVGMGEPIDVTGISASHVFGAGNLVSTAEDLVTFYGALAAGEVVSEGQLDAMFSEDPHVPGTRYGMGIWRFDDLHPCATFIGHDGGIAGYDSTGYSRIDGRRQFSVLVNSLTTDDKAGDPAAQEAFGNVVALAACNQPR